MLKNLLSIGAIHELTMCHKLKHAANWEIEQDLLLSGEKAWQIVGKFCVVMLRLCVYLYQTQNRIAFFGKNRFYELLLSQCSEYIRMAIIQGIKLNWPLFKGTNLKVRMSDEK